MSMDYQEFSRLWSSGHGNASTHGLVGAWLQISYRLAKVCTAARITPNLLTFFGVIAACATAIYSPHWWITFPLLISLLCDGIDGSTAIVQNRSNKLGATLDAVADRVSEALWAVAFYRLGAPLTWVVALWTVTAFQEYARARLGSEGIHEVGVVTPAERPVRAILLFLAILVVQFHSKHNWLNEIAIFMTLLQTFSFGLILTFARRSLR